MVESLGLYQCGMNIILFRLGQFLFYGVFIVSIEPSTLFRVEHVLKLNAYVGGVGLF